MTEQTQVAPAVDTTKARTPSYLSASGEYTIEPTPDVTGVRFEVNGETVTANFDSFPATIINQLTAFGLKTALQNAINSAAKEGNSKERFEARYNGFIAGQWASRSGPRESGPKTPLIVQAAREAYETMKVKLPAGLEDWDTWEEAMTEKWASLDKKGQKENFKRFYAIAQVAKVYDRKEAELRTSKLGIEKQSKVSPADVFMIG